MPWSQKDAHRHTHKANTAKKKRQWAHVSDSCLIKHPSEEGRCIREANAVIAQGHLRGRR